MKPPVTSTITAARMRNFTRGLIASALARHRAQFALWTWSQCQHAAARDGQQCEISGGIGAGVNVDPVGPNVRRTHRGVAVNDIFAEIILRLEELVPDP